MAYLYFAKVNVNNDIFKVYEGEKSIEEILNRLILSVNTEDNIILPKNRGYIKFITLSTNV